MFRSITAVSILSLVAAFSGSSSLEQGAGALTQGSTDNVVLAKYRSNILEQERELIVHLPRGYERKKQYPVLYVLDGSSQDQPLASTLDRLSAQGLVPHTIVVGIPNMSGANRTFQLVPPFMRTDPANPESPKGTGDRFLDFMEKELVPFVEKQYGANDTRLFAGNSRGGLLVMYSLLAKPDLFAGRFCFSTPLWRENNLLVERVSASFSDRPAVKSFLYLSAGENETDDIKNGNDAMALALRTRAPAGLVWYVERTPGVDHSRNAQMSGLSALTKWGAFAKSRSDDEPPRLHDVTETRRGYLR
jgi:predicted alpha/beta superfamily hydrolase